MTVSTVKSCHVALAKIPEALQSCCPLKSIGYGHLTRYLLRFVISKLHPVIQKNSSMAILVGESVGPLFYHRERSRFRTVSSIEITFMAGTIVIYSPVVRSCTDSYIYIAKARLVNS